MFTKKIDAPSTLLPSPSIKVNCCAFKPIIRSESRTKQEIYFESRGKCCKKLLQFNGYPNKVNKLYMDCCIVIKKIQLASILCCIGSIISRGRMGEKRYFQLPHDKTMPMVEESLRNRGNYWN